MKSYQTRLWDRPTPNGSTTFQQLEEVARLYSAIERKLFVQLTVHQRKIAPLKKEFQRRYGINARQFNSIRMQLEGKIASVLSRQEARIEELQVKIEAVQRTITSNETRKQELHEKLIHTKQSHTKFQVLVKQYRRVKFVIHQKKRKLASLQRTIQRLEEAVKNKRVRICFGSQALFRKQFHLAQHGYHHHKQWKRDWKQARSSQFMLVGSSDETYGNQNCQFQPIKQKNGDISDYQLQLTLPPVLQQTLPSHDSNKKKQIWKHLLFPHVSFHKGQAAVVKGSSLKQKGRVHSALTYRFLKREEKWYVSVTVDIPVPRWITLQRYGYIGVDLNATRLAVCEVDRNGNPMHSFSLPLRMYDRRSGQLEASMSDALTHIVTYAKGKQKPIVMEKLSFVQKKRALGEASSRYARMLSGFAYRTYTTLMESKCKAHGIQLLSVNPAYTSQIGAMKWMKRYGLSSHEAAACMIARKGFLYRIISLRGVSLLSYPTKWDPQHKRFGQWVSWTKHVNKELSYRQKLELWKVL